MRHDGENGERRQVNPTQSLTDVESQSHDVIGEVLGNSSLLELDDLSDGELDDRAEVLHDLLLDFLVDLRALEDRLQVYQGLFQDLLDSWDVLVSS